MNKIKTIILMLAAVLLVSCNKNGSDIVSDAVIAAFQKKYPDASNVQWNIQGDYAVATFTTGSTLKSTAANGSYTNSAWFLNAAAAWQMSVGEVPFSELPEAVKTAFSASTYASWKHDDDCDVILREGGLVKLYIIEVEKTINGVETDVDLYFDETGKLLNEVVKVDKQRDYTAHLPQDITSTITDFLNSLGGYKIVDIDKENGGTEVEVVVNGKKIECFFDAAGAWRYTKTEYTYNEVPQNIKAFLEQVPAYNSSRIDDIKKVEYAGSDKGDKKEYWHFELETLFDDDREVNVYVDKTGIIKEPVISLGTGVNQTSGNAKIDEFIKSKYQGAGILEHEAKRGYIEVKIQIDGKIKDVLFDANGNWVRTETEMKYSEIPQAVRDYILNNGYQASVEEIEYVETANEGNYYIVEATKEGKEYELYISSDGKLIKVLND